MFRLRRLLDWKEMQEKEALLTRLSVEARLQALRTELERSRAAQQDLPNHDAQGQDLVEDLLQWAMYAEGLRRREDELRKKVEEMIPIVQEKTQKHQELRQETEGLKRLEERELRRVKKERAERELVAVDEAASRRFLPGSGNTFPLDEADEGRIQDT